MGCKEFKDICVGDFKHKITIEQPVEVSDGQGGFTVTWNTFAEPFSKITPKKAQQIFFAQQLQHQVSHELLMRYVSGLLADMRISFDGRIFQIRQIIDISEMKRYHRVMAWENKQS